VKRLAAFAPVAVLVALGLLFTLFGLRNDPKFLPRAMVGKPVPEVVLPTLADGLPETLSDPGGQPYLVNVFASWCAPCEIEAPVLVELKARRLLPGRDDIDLDDELALWEERDLLLARLLECKTFKDVASVFSRLADEADRSFPRQAGPDERFAELMPDLLEGTHPRRLQAAYLRVITPKPVPRIDLFHVAPIRLSVADAMAELIDELPRVGRISFARLTGGLVERLEVIVRFLALLELFKQGAVDLDQAERFGDIDIVWNGLVVGADEASIDDYDG
jgi:segregation and condensation protein A